MKNNRIKLFLKKIKNTFRYSFELCSICILTGSQEFQLIFDGIRIFQRELFVSLQLVKSILPRILLEKLDKIFLSACKKTFLVVKI